MLIFASMLIFSSSSFESCLFSRHAYFRTNAYYRESTVSKSLKQRRGPTTKLRIFKYRAQKQNMGSSLHIFEPDRYIFLLLQSIVVLIELLAKLWSWWVLPLILRSIGSQNFHLFHGAKQNLIKYRQKFLFLEKSTHFKSVRFLAR